MQSKTLQAGVTLEWPKTSFFKLSYGDISVYNLVLTSDNAEPLAVEATTRASGCLLRPKRFLVPGKSSTTLTLAIKPGSTFEKEDLKRTDSIYLITVLRSARQVDDLEALFDMANREKIAGICLKNELFFTYIPPTEEKAASDQVSQIQIKGLAASRLTFQYTSPGYITAYLFIKCTLAADATGCTAWRLTPPSPSFWYSVQNPSELGEFPCEGAQHDQYAFGFLSPGESHFTYIDLKANGERCFQEGEAFNGGEQDFVLEAHPLVVNPKQRDKASSDFSDLAITFALTLLEKNLKLPFKIKSKQEWATLLPSNLVELLGNDVFAKTVQEPSTKETRTFVFTGPYNQPRSASITISNPSPTHTLAYRLHAQEPSSFFKFNGSIQLCPSSTAECTVEFNLDARFAGTLPPPKQLNRNQLFRLDTFQLHTFPKTDDGKDNYWPAMLQSMDARQMVTTFIPVLFKEEKALPEERKGQMGDTLSTAIPQSAGKPSPGSTVKSPSGAANSAQPSPGTPPSNPALTSSSLPMTAPTEAQRKSSAPVPNSSLLRNRHQENDKKTKKRVSPKGPSTHKKTVSPGTAKPRRTQSKQVTPSKPRTAQSPPVSPRQAPRHHLSPRRLPCRVPFSPVGIPPEEDMFELFNLLLIMTIYLILLNALIIVLA